KVKVFCGIVFHRWNAVYHYLRLKIFLNASFPAEAGFSAIDFLKYAIRYGNKYVNIRILNTYNMYVYYVNKRSYQEKPTLMKATKINLLDFKSPPMKAFHLTWITFFLCFFGWFGIAPLMPVVRQDLGLTKAEIGNIIIASVA